MKNVVNKHYYLTSDLILITNTTREDIINNYWKGKETLFGFSKDNR